MNDQQIPHDILTPSSRELLKSTMLAIVFAAVLLVTTILPAEYAIDPTGIGRLIGLAQMGESKQRAYTQTLNDVSEILDRASERQAIFTMQKQLESMERDLAVIKTTIGPNKNNGAQQ